ncbi:MAG: coenzyme F420-0:L-glutamate ligase [Thaumarchaeota archaeon]|nr:coenzyme F420-0:L-glutamate ligase [Nitrososphaerota archaeon]
MICLGNVCLLRSTGSLQVIPIRTEVKSRPFDLAECVWLALARNRAILENGDILVVSTKFASISEGRVKKLADVTPTKKALTLAKRYKIDASLAQLVVEESDTILGGVPGFLVSITRGTLAPNAGIDRSNVPRGWAVLYPKNPELTARKLRQSLLNLAAKSNSEKISNLGVILSDSRVTPTRLGTIGIALSTAGIRPTVDMRGETDLFGRKLKVTLRAIADQVASTAQLVMGEAGEGVPIALIKGVDIAFAKPKNAFEKEMVISSEKCLILNGLRNRYDP